MQVQKPTAIWAYPWDLEDEGLECSLGRIADLGLQGICVAVSYHAAMLLEPHNPRARVYFTEDGAIYFPPGSAFDGLTVRPRISRIVATGDPLERICRAAEGAGLSVTAWTICLHNAYLGERYPQLTIQNAFGDPLMYALCPCQPAVQDYVSALLVSLRAYPLRALQLESYGYMGFPHGYHHEKVNTPLGELGSTLMGCCFCPACLGQAEDEGIDGQAVRAVVRGILTDIMEGRGGHPVSAAEGISEVPALVRYLAMRRGVVERLVGDLSRVARRPLDLIGIEPESVTALARYIGGITECAYHVTAEEVRNAVVRFRAKIRSERPLIVGLDASPHLTPTERNMVEKVDAAWRAGADGLCIYNYGLMPLRSLQWLRRALR